jgi:3-hydroxyacyl-[acyl-carrier-protein] dehydratase
MLNSFPDLLHALPQGEPFRFVDEVVAADERHIVCRYTFRRDEAFYRGHFPGRPITPGVILLEAMAQAGVVLQGIYLLMSEGISPDAYRTMFTDAQVEWHAQVLPGETVTIGSELIAWRRMRIRSQVELRTGDGRLAASGALGGIGVPL